MTEFEVAGENGHRVRVLAEDEVEAFETAITVDPDIEMGGAYPAADLPIGWDGGDAEDAEALGQSIDNGDHV
ncbi:MAG TPA: hypothetical protein VEW95_09520 [Candidatus Limnocylindrales bacterium]|nr:hypothetical protein [Candidatus Limnocylindrales bacterium]